MRIELKNVKYAAFNSHDSHCFEATVYVDGKKAGTASDDGWGGQTVISPDSLQKKLDDYAKTLPPIDCSEFGGNGTMESSAEIIIGDLVNEWLEKREQRRLCSRKVLFRKPTETYKDGEYHTIKGKFTPEIKAHLVSKYGPSVYILNENVA